MDKKRLGATGIELTHIGFGAFKIGRNESIKYPQGYALPDDAAASRLLHGVLDLGINYIDTAPAYGVSEARIGAALSGRRDEFVISTKVGETFEDGRSTYDFTAEAIRQSVHRSLERLRTESLDIVFIHSDGNDLAILEHTDAPAELVALREAGVIRAVGFSGKTPAGAITALEWADAIMVEYNASDQGHAEAMKLAHSRDIGIVVKKGLASGTLDPAEAIPFVLDQPEVTSLVIGGLDLEHLRANVAIAAR